MIFRQAVPADVPALIEIRLSVDENTLSEPNKVTPAMCTDYLTQAGRGWVCEIDGQVAGFSIAAISDASIWALFIRPGFERRGIGTRLLDLAVRWLFENGAEYVNLTTGPDTRAARFYESRGWLKTGSATEGEIAFRLTDPSGLG
jgi:GNAT superfamily N-acetyltransferase